MSEVNKSEQWLLDGKCRICRRKEYCNKPCKKCKSRREYELRCEVTRTMLGTLMGRYKK